MPSVRVSLKKKLSVLLLGVTLLSAFILGRIELHALLSTVIILGMAYQIPTWASSKQTKPVSYIGLAIILIWSAMLFLHLIPGFNNIQVLDNVIKSPESASFSMYINLDKPMAFFALILAYPKLLGDHKKWQLPPTIWTIICLFSLFPIAVLLGESKSEFSLPSWWWLFALNNLLLTCVAEEALFRGFIQQSLTHRFNLPIGVLVASAMFGLAHYSGGPLLIIFATLAGLNYGLIFHFTHRLWCAVLIHFLFNLTHLIFFTYPVLAP
ncbi:hypothetical protein VSVS12_04566 (plasmid) [Vibrio scophthalmi]|nr:hypothetical protein VSVS12_04566 [Vibrio scophthalmi]